MHTAINDYDNYSPNSSQSLCSLYHRLILEENFPWTIDFVLYFQLSPNFRVLHNNRTWRIARQVKCRLAMSRELRSISTAEQLKYDFRIRFMGTSIVSMCLYIANLLRCNKNSINTFTLLAQFIQFLEVFQTIPS